MKRRKILYGFMALLLVLCLLITFLVTTETGLRLSMLIAKRFIPGQLHYNKLRGSLNKSIKLSGVNYAHEKQHINVNNADIKLKLWSLLTGKLDINAQLINIKVISSKQKTTNKTTLNLRFVATDQQWQLHAVVTHFDPSVFQNSYAGDISFSLLASAKQQNHVWLSDWQIPRLSGQLHHQAISATAQFSLQNNRLAKIQLNGHLHHNQVLIHGSGLPQLKLNWQINFKTLHELAPLLSGSLVSNGQASGSLQHPVIKATVNAKHIGYQQLHFQQVQAQLDLNFIKHQFSVFKLEGKQIQLGKLLVKHLTSGISNQNHRQRFITHLQFKQSSMQMMLQGYHHHQQGAWLGQIVQFSLYDRHKHLWQLKQPASFKATTTRINAAPFCLVYQKQHICMNLKWLYQHALNTEISLSDFPLDDLQEFYPPNLVITPRLNLTLSLNKAYHQAWLGQINASLSSGEIYYPIMSQLETIHLRQGSLHLTLAPRKTSLTSDIELSQGERISAKLHLPDYKAWQLPPSGHEKIAGSVHIDLPHLHLLSRLIPQLQDVAGSLSSDIKLGGILQQPNISGQLYLRHVKAFLPQFGTRIDPGFLTLTVNQQQQVTLQGKIENNGGALIVNGQGQLNFQQPRATLNIQGDNFLIANNQQAKIYVSPNLAIKFQDKHVNITGKVTIPKADITPTDYKKNNVVQAEDIVLVQNGKPIAANTNYELNSNVHLHLGDKVYLKFLGIDSRIVGNLLISSENNRPTNATGVLRSIDGKYDAYGQKLKITRGELSFNGGPIDNPGLNIQASRSIRVVANSPSFQLNAAGFNSQSVFLSQTPNITLGVNVQNTLRNPVINLFSDPSGLSQADILSYLLIGRPANNASAADGQTLVSAANALQLNGLNVSSFTDKIQSALGLNQLSIESEQNMDKENNMVENTSLVLGKYLTPRLYIDYSVGLLQPINTFRVRYTLSKRWVAQASSNVFGNGGDLFYSIER